ncbi:MAG: YlxR family protein [Eggerthellaceae bacterium]|nr:YlxR family protein [Eggerthellaceae bacterium]
MSHVSSGSAPAPKRIRTCICCGAKSTKTSLHRIVRTPAGQVEYDPKGRSPGRGAYVCSLECFERACKTRKIDRALKMSVDEQDRERLNRVMREALCDTSE